jgi:hypothetical protein
MWVKVRSAVPSIDRCVAREGSQAPARSAYHDLLRRAQATARSTTAIDARLTTSGNHTCATQGVGIKNIPCQERGRPADEQPQVRVVEDIPKREHPEKEATSLASRRHRQQGRSPDAALPAAAQRLKSTRSTRRLPVRRNARQAVECGAMALRVPWSRPACAVVALSQRALAVGSSSHLAHYCCEAPQGGRAVGQSGRGKRFDQRRRR